MEFPESSKVHIFSIPLPLEWVQGGVSRPFFILLDFSLIPDPDRRLERMEQ